MSTTTKIDFDPGLFDDLHCEEEPELPIIKPKQRASRTFIVFSIVIGSLLLAVVAAFLAIITKSEPKILEATRAIESPQPLLVGPSSQYMMHIPASQTVYTSYFSCEGHEAICSTSTTEKPAEFLAKLAAALPKGNAERYQVKVSVIPLGEQ